MHAVFENFHWIFEIKHRITECYRNTAQWKTTAEFRGPTQNQSESACEPYSLTWFAVTTDPEGDVETAEEQDSGSDDSKNEDNAELDSESDEEEAVETSPAWKVADTVAIAFED